MTDSNYKSVSSRMLDYIARQERGMFMKAAAEVSDAAMVADAGGAQAPPPTMSETLMMMSQDPSTDPTQRQYMMEAASRIQSVDAPPPPVQQEEAPPAPVEGEGQPPPEAVPMAPDEAAQMGAKAASLRDSLDDFGDTINTNGPQGNKLAQSSVIEARILNMLRNPNSY
jgi:hypothetical protein